MRILQFGISLALFVCAAGKFKIVLNITTELTSIWLVLIVLWRSVAY